MPFGDFGGLTVGQPPAGPVPAYPLASNLTGSLGMPAADDASTSHHPTPAGPHLSPAAGHHPTATTSATSATPATPGAPGVPDAVREQLRALIIEELQQLIQG